MTVQISVSFETPLNCRYSPKQTAIKICKKLDLVSATIDITFVDKKTIKKLNKTHLNHDYVTDILTFNLNTTETPIGDIYICPDKAKENAKTFHHTFENEVHLLVIHGILHLIGYTDEKEEEKEKMDKRQWALLTWLQNERQKK